MSTLSDPGVDVVVCNLASDTDLSDTPKGYCRAILVAEAGDLSIVTRRGNTVTFPVPAGTVPIGATIIRSTANGTTAVGVTAIL